MTEPYKKTALIALKILDYFHSLLAEQSSKEMSKLHGDQENLKRLKEFISGMDHVHIHSFYKLALMKKNQISSEVIIGLAPLRGICKKRGFSAIEIQGYHTWSTMAHELGHKYSKNSLYVLHEYYYIYFQF